jgi:hypothetical protein
MIENFQDLYQVLISTLIILLVLYFIYRKKMFSFYDPLFFYLITQAFSIELGFLQIRDFNYLLNFVVSQLFFALAFVLFSKNINSGRFINDINLSFRGNEYRFWSAFTYFGFVIVLFSNLYLFYKQGVILFSEDPTLGKVSAFQGGGGIGAVRRINWGLLKIINLSAIFLFIKTKKKTYLFLLIILMFITVSGGAKSSVLFYVFIFSILGQFNSIKISKNFKRLNKLKLPIITLGIFLSLFILGYKSNGLDDALIKLGIRFLYYGDILFYYYETSSVLHFQQLGFLDFLENEFNSIFGLIRVTTYIEPLSYKMVKFSFGSSETLDIVTGPNLPYYVKGNIFFGNYGVYIYSFLVGAFIAVFRNKLFIKKNKSYTKYILLIFINLSLFSFAQDSALTISIFFDTFVFGIIPTIFALMLTYNSTINKFY